jgi:hypothetical protein
MHCSGLAAGAQVPGFWHNLLDMSPDRPFQTRSRRAALLVGLLLGLCLRVAAQAPTVPTVTFNLVFPGSLPDKYTIVVPGDGSASYHSTGKMTADAESDDFRSDFPLSDSTRTRVFDLAKRAHYFEGEIDSKKKGLAFTGEKTLSYRDAERDTKASYNYSTIPAVQELTQLFQELSTTLEFGRRLEYYHRYQKLALDDELKRMEEMAQQNNLPELAAVAPILQKLAQDRSVINPVRARAERLLERAGAGH